jgi:hypothetical protein
MGNSRQKEPTRQELNNEATVQGAKMTCSISIRLKQCAQEEEEQQQQQHVDLSKRFL